MSTISIVERRNDFSLTERTLFSLFARYPEISFDAGVRNAPKCVNEPQKDVSEIESSPISVSEDYDTSRLSSSTAQTTPLRPLYLLQQRQLHSTDSVAGYLRCIRQTDLPEACRLCFTSLVQSIGAISGGLVPSTNGRYRINNTYFMDQCSIMLREVEMLSERTNDQVHRVEYLKSLVIFKAIPPDEVLWSTYRQRAMLVIRHTALPSLSEAHLIHNLALLYNNVLYLPAQDLYDNSELESTTSRTLNALYDALFTWSTIYSQWCKAMTGLKKNYITPLVTRIVASEAVWSDVKSMQRAKRKAEIALTNPVGPSMLPMDEMVLKTLNLSARRKEAVVPSKMKIRMRKRRESTI